MLFLKPIPCTVNKIPERKNGDKISKRKKMWFVLFRNRRSKTRAITYVVSRIPPTSLYL